MRQRLSRGQAVVILLLVSLILPSSVPAKSTDFPIRYRAASPGERPAYTFATDRSGIFGTALPFGRIDNSGVYVADVNNDYWPDVLVLGGKQPALFINQNGRFQKRKGFPDLRDTMGAALFLDLNRDDLMDLIMIPVRGHPVLLINEEGRFRVERRIDDVTLKQGNGAISGDFTANGCPDVVLLQYGLPERALPLNFRRRRLGLGPIPGDNGLRNVFLRNNCESLVPSGSFLPRTRHWSLSGRVIRFNGDTYPDLYVANQSHRDSVYVNENGNGFTIRSIGGYTTSTSVATNDVNGDARADLFVSGISDPDGNPLLNASKFRAQYSSEPGGNRLFLSGNDGFRNRTDEYGFGGNGWGWGATFGDFDNDARRELIQVREDLTGFEPHDQLFNRTKTVADFLRVPDLFFGSSRERSVYESLKDWVGYPAFWDVSERGPEPLDGYALGFSRFPGRGISQLDYNRDGRLDVLASKPEGPVSFFRATAPDTVNNGWVTVDYSSITSNGTVTVTVAGRRKTYFLSSRTGFHSQQPRRLHIGLDGNNHLESLRYRGMHEDAGYRVGEVTSGRVIVLGDDDASVVRPGR